MNFAQFETCNFMTFFFFKIGGFLQEFNFAVYSELLKASKSCLAENVCFQLLREGENFLLVQHSEFKTLSVVRLNFFSTLQMIEIYNIICGCLYSICMASMICDTDMIYLLLRVRFSLWSPSLSGIRGHSQLVSQLLFTKNNPLH